MSILRPTTLKRTLFFVFFDAVVLLVTLYGGFLLRFNFDIPHGILQNFWLVYVSLTALTVSLLALFDCYGAIWRFFSLKNFVVALKAITLSFAVFGAAMVIANWPNPFPRSVIVIDLALFVIGFGAVRAAKRIYIEAFIAKEHPTVIIGASDEGELAARHLLSGSMGMYPVIFVDDDPSKIGTNIHNIKVFPTQALESLVEKYGIDAAVIARALEPSELSSLLERFDALGIKTIKKVSIYSESPKLQDISIEDLLARKPKDLDKAAIGDFLRNKVVMVTGAGGSIGSEIVRQCRSYGAKKLILVDNSEYNLYRIKEQLGDFDAVTAMISVTDDKRLRDLFSLHRPQVVIHAAAYKHVPLVEENPDIAVENNIVGSMQCMLAAIDFGVDKFVLISTDKAVRPTNIMGATKRVCELFAQNVPSGKTEIVAVRFGNVIGSSGSVVPKFREQIQAGGPVTVTHPEVERYFMLISEACELVLQTATIAHGGEVFILDMGERVKIVDLAKKMISLSGKEGKVQIVFTGLRTGEKLYEELLTDDTLSETRYHSIMIAKPTPYDIHALKTDIEELLSSSDKIAALKKIVPEFSHQTNS